jgi:hypothetical protein
VSVLEGFRYEDTHSWVQAQRFVDDAIEVRDIGYVFAVEVRLSWRDGIDNVAELGLDGGVLAEFVGKEREGH